MQNKAQDKPALKVVGHHYDGYCNVVKFNNGQEAANPDPLRLQRTVDRILEGAFTVGIWDKDTFFASVSPMRVVERAQ